MKVYFTFCICLLTYPLFAQPETEPFKQVIKNLFDAIQKGDSAAARKCLMPEIRLQTALENTKTGKTRLTTESADSFLVQVHAIKEKGLQVEERMITCDIQIDFPMAAAWVTYEFYVNGKFSHKGVDAFQLFYSETGWKIIQVCDTRKR